jgi:DNA repair exonuclease SbcCD ATPase subunit
LFGKTNTNKAKTLGDLFNNYLPDERTLTAEGCITIDGDDYIIKRTLTRPSAGKKTKTVTNKVEYYRVMADGTETLLEDENQQGASAKDTNKIIKEALGNESDFDLIISANAKDLDSLISLTETEKGRLLSRWIGLSVIEDKDAKAREKWNKEISVGRYSDIYNKATLESDIEELSTENQNIHDEIEKCKNDIVACDGKLKDFNQTRDALLSSKKTIDSKLLQVDVKTLEATIAKITEDGKKKKLDLKFQNEELAKYGDVEYSETEYAELKAEKDNLISEMAELRTNIKHLKDTNTNLEKAEYCPTCHRKFDNVDNSAVIEENKKKIEAMTNDGINKNKRLETVNSEIAKIEQKINMAKEKSKIELKIATINSEITSKRLEYTEKKNLLEEVNKNKEAITKNSEIDAAINVVNSNIKNEETIKASKTLTISNDEKLLSKNLETIAQKKSYIVKIDEERKIEKYWKLYLQMIGKDGISKMVLRNTLPIINCELNRLLSDVSDFSIDITMNEKNDIDFLLIRDGVITRLAAASGLEKTQASLALRVVLGRLSTLSRPPFILLDEILGTVAKKTMMI